MNKFFCTFFTVIFSLSLSAQTLTTQTEVNDYQANHCSGNPCNAVGNLTIESVLVGDVITNLNGLSTVTSAQVLKIQHNQAH